MVNLVITSLHNQTSSSISNRRINLYYNSCDVVLNVASNEGFGLGSCEAMRAGTPIIVNVTGGLQDQCGFRKDGKLLTAEDYVEIGSLHQRRKWKDKLEHGEWVKPIWPTNLSLTRVTCYSLYI